MFKHFGLSTVSVILGVVSMTLGVADLHAQSGLEYVEDRVRITPKNNVFDKSNPRDLNFVVHHPDTDLESITRNGEEVEFDYFVFTGLGADGQSLDLPETAKLDIKQDFLETLGLGEHTLKFNFTDGTVREFTLDVVDESTKQDYDIEIISFNVEHGDCVFIDLPTKNILVDAAPGNMAEERAVPMLEEKGVERIDYIFITHWHWDHVDGLQYFIEDFDGYDDQTGWVNADPGGFEVGEIWHNLSDNSDGGGEEASGQTHSSMFEVGNEFEIDGADFKVLNAAQFDEDKYPSHKSVGSGRNRQSLAFRMEYNGFVYQHGGDVYGDGQNAALEAFGADSIKSHIYHGNHHFHGGLSRDYLKKINPYLFLTPAQQATYNRTAYVEGVMGEVVPYLEENRDRFIENLFAFEAGHTTIKANGQNDWQYETHYINQAETTVPKSLSFKKPTDGDKFDVGESINVGIDMADSGVKIDRVQLLRSGELLTEISEPPYEYTWKNPDEGRYRLTAEGLDSEGNLVSTSRENPLITVGDVAAPDTLVHHWSFDEESGDYAANSVNVLGGNVNGATWTDGKYGNALSFDGSDDYVSIPHDSSLSFNKEFTITAWIYMKDPSGGHQVLQKGTNYSLFEARSDGGNPSNVYKDSNEWHLLKYTKSKDFFANEWHHIALTYDGDTATNYIDGEKDQEFNVPAEVVVNTDNLAIGTNAPWKTHFFNGKIDEVAIYEVALSPSEINMVYNNNLALPVELASLDARISEETATLTWTTASETNNAGFAVQHRSDTTGQWQKLGFVESKAQGGTTTEAKTYRFQTEMLKIGTHQFRLRQVDTDGSVYLTDPITAKVRMQEAYRVTSYPNPVSGQAIIKMASRKKQEVRIALYDVLGRRVATLHDGPVPAQETETITLDARQEGLSSGTYFLRLVGEEGTRTSRLTVVR